MIDKVKAIRVRVRVRVRVRIRVRVRVGVRVRVTRFVLPCPFLIPVFRLEAFFQWIH